MKLIFERTCSCSASGRSADNLRWWIAAAPGWEKKPATILRCAWKRGRVHAMAVDGNTNAARRLSFSNRCERFPRPLIVIWDNGPAHRGETIRTYLSTPDLRLRLIALPPYSPDFNPDEAIWQWIRAEMTVNTCFGTTEKVREKVDVFFLPVWFIGLQRSSNAASGNSKLWPTV